ncbi:hypothetical protein CC78DRAFT_599597 [Lojkania enalia]|uniref:Uncharacterized protein n=1 Tax=Lojkania enalia TaxID=147567 RepID=A0A9P4TR93_9PLEO|nr:hypothetical protein CC78DRAFT_599597 [Didymosphaeria enalia]
MKDRKRPYTALGESLSSRAVNCGRIAGRRRLVEPRAAKNFRSQAMFANVLNTARRIFSRSPSVQGRLSESRDVTLRISDPDVNMVSTRSGIVADATPHSSARKIKRALDVEDMEDTPAQPSKRRKSVHTADETPRMEEKRLPFRSASPKVIIRKKTSPPTDVEQSHTKRLGEREPSPDQDAEFHTPSAAQSNSVYVTPATSRKTEELSLTPKAKLDEDGKTPASNTKFSDRGRKKKKNLLPVNMDGTMAEPQEKELAQTTSDVETPTSKFPAEITSSTFGNKYAHISTQEIDFEKQQALEIKSKKIRFGSEEPTSTGPLIVNQQGYNRFGVDNEVKGSNVAAENDEDEASDSDEAPEMVTAASALSKAQATKADAERAYKAQQEKQNKRRKELANRIVEEQKEKRKREEKKAKKLVKKEARLQRAEESKPALDVDIHNLPDLLPESLLEAAGDKRPPTPPVTISGKSVEERRKEKLKRHIKFLESGEKPIKDVKKGPVNVHVLMQQNPLLAPKVNRNTKNIREQWLKGRELDKKRKNGQKKMMFKKVERKPMSKGFVRDEDF